MNNWLWCRAVSGRSARTHSPVWKNFPEKPRLKVKLGTRDLSLFWVFSKAWEPQNKPANHTHVLQPIQCRVQPSSRSSEALSLCPHGLRLEETLIHSSYACSVQKWIWIHTVELHQRLVNLYSWGQGGAEARGQSGVCVQLILQAPRHSSAQTLRT